MYNVLSEDVSRLVVTSSKSVTVVKALKFNLSHTPGTLMPWLIVILSVPTPETFAKTLSSLVLLV